MNVALRPARKRLAPVAALAVAAAGLVGAGFATGDSATAATAAASTPALKLVTPLATQTVERDKGERVYLYDLGFYLVADPAAVEIRARRPAYDQPIQATLSVGTGPSATVTTLPTGLVTSVDDLEKFFAITVTNSAGKVVMAKKLPFCPNSYDAARAEPGGAATSPYPYECGDHPFAIGDVFGIQRGWSVSALNDYESTPSFPGPDGTYTVKLQINKAWRVALGMSSTQALTSTRIKVKTDKDGDPARLPTQSTAIAAARARAQHRSAQPAAGRSANAQPAATRPKDRISAAAAADGPEPDLRALPAYEIGLDRLDANGNPTKKTYLDFGATVWNAGPSPLLVDGFRRPGTDLMDAYQYFFDNAGNEVGSAPAGTLQWDGRPGHDHWHFTAFASYRLLNSTQKTTLISGKEAFCLAPTDAIDLTLDGADWQPDSTGLETACGQGDEGALSIREVLNAGWGDTYSQDLPGQSFNVTKVPNGVYYIEVLANPDHKLTESSTTNNRALRKIKLGGKVGGKRTIKVYAYKGIKAP